MKVRDSVIERFRVLIVSKSLRLLLGVLLCILL